jgi:hypothetical protein
MHQQTALGSAVNVHFRYGVRVAHIETIGTLFNDDEEVGGGSGLLIGEDLILTNDHVIPKESNYRTLKILIRLKCRKCTPVAVTEFYRDPERDLALLQLAAPVPDAAGPGCPMSVIRDAGSAPVGTSIYVLGFPLNQDLSITGGIISNHSSANGRWQTDTVINPGNSGGPAFDGTGALIGIAVAGATTWSFGGRTIDVDGVNFIIPSPRLRESPLYDRIVGLPSDRRCWSDQGEEIDLASVVRSADVPTTANGAGDSFGMPGSDFGMAGGEAKMGGRVAAMADGEAEMAEIEVETFDLPQTINRVFTFSESADRPVSSSEDARPHERSFNAEPGYRITSCSLEVQSANHARHEACRVNPDKNSATFEVHLQTGPDAALGPGWWAGALTLHQERAR